jgi:hypothetical protein
MELEDYYEDEERDQKRRIFLRNVRHIYNKAIFDAFNDCLDQKRPFGQWGQPFSWQVIPTFKHEYTMKTKSVLFHSQRSS